MKDHLGYILDLWEWHPIISVSSRSIWGYTCSFVVIQSLCPTLCDSMDCSTPGFPVLHYFPEFAQVFVWWVSDAIQQSSPLSPLLFLPSIFPSTEIFSNESAFHIRWPKYWSFSFCINPSNEYSELISFRIDCFDLLAVQESIRLLRVPQFESINSLALSLLYGPSLTSSTWLLKNP